MPKKPKGMLTANIGPSFPIVPVTGFTKFKFPKGTLEDLWSIIGPTVKTNMDKRMHLWEIFAICYAQGLENGASLNEDSSRSSEHGQAS